MEKSVSKALEVAGLNERDVSPFMRIRIVGLTSLTYEGEHKPKEGIVTIWNPTESQVTLKMPLYLKCFMHILKEGTFPSGLYVLHEPFPYELRHKG